MGMELVAGRDFSRLLLTDIGADGHAIVNEAMVKARGWQQPLGKRIFTSKIIGVVKDFHSGICIFISCLGLFGLTAFAAEQRGREIGIRKVLGASVSQIIIMLARNILWLVLAGSVIASAVAYFTMNEWLSRFAYRIRIHPQAFVISAAAVIALAFITIALQSYRAAKTNPARIIRYE
jgi:putative ABC transport system permease protein